MRVKFSVDAGDQRICPHHKGAIIRASLKLEYPFQLPVELRDERTRIDQVLLDIGV